MKIRHINFLILIALCVLAIKVFAQNVSPVADASDISGQPETINTGRTCVISTVYSDADGLADLAFCYLRIDHPTFPLTMQFDVATNQAQVWSGDQGANFLSPISVQRTDFPGSNSINLKWQFFLLPEWPLIESGINFQVYVEDQSNATDGWNSDGLSIAYAEPDYGTTIIAHGYQFLATQPPDWVRSMGIAIGSRLGNARVRQLNPGTGLFELLGNGIIGSGSDWEEILIVDWADESDINTKGFSEAAADAFVSAVLRHQIENPSPQFLDRIHLIGHSRGTVIISEMAERFLVLAKESVAEDFRFSGNIAEYISLTYLDTHPVWGDAVSNNINVDQVNPSEQERDQVLVWDGIDLGENYYQPISSSPHFLDPDGLPVYAAYNRNLDETILNEQGANDQINHSGVHAWYFGTIDPTASEDELVAMIAEEQGNRPKTLAKPNDLAISINRSLWYNDNLGIIEGFAHSDHGGSVTYVDSLTQFDPSVPTVPFYDNKTDAFFDGDFFYSGNDITNGGAPAWQSQGGAGSATIQDEQLILTATSTGGDRSRTHNWFYISRQATALQFFIDVVSSDEATLEVKLGDLLLDFWEVSSLSRQSLLSIRLANDELKGYTNTVTFELTGNPASTVEIIIDDIELVFPDNSVTLLAPNGGETWLINELQEIQWTKTGTFDSFTLQYSINDGNDWINIDENIIGADSTYLWTVPDNPSENCLVQVIGFFGSQNASDICNNSFIISLASNLFSQNGISPNCFYLYQNYPNPFNPRTIISYQLPARSKVNLKIYNMLGKTVQTLINDYQEAGRHSIGWQPQNLSSGVFVVFLEAGNFRQIRKVVYLK